MGAPRVIKPTLDPDYKFKHCTRADIKFAGKDPNNIHYDCRAYPWPSDATEELKALAIAKFEEVKKTGKPVRLVISNHWATQGYWVEIGNQTLTPLPHHDLVMRKANID